MLELWQQDADIAARPQPQEAKDLPTTFGETFGAAWSRNQLFGQNVLGENDRLDALGDYLNTIKQKTGEDLAPELDYGGASGFMTPAAGLLMQANDKLAALKQKNPALELEPMTGDQLEQGAVAKRRQADADFAATMGRERGPGATVGAVTGGVAAGVADPINIVALPFVPEEGLGILANALRWGAIGAGTQVVSEAVQAPYQEQVQPGYLESGEPLANIATAGLFAAGGAAGFKALGDIWSRVKTGAWPTSVRDAGNLVESEANIAGSNIYGGPGGEAAHRAALSKSIDNILAGMPVRVDEIITPELEAQSRALMTRLEGERAVSLPVYDERTIRLMSEEAGLQQQHGELGAELEGLPEGDISAADRLNRLQAVNAQLEGASPEMRRALLQRRDQILVDTTPEALQAAAEPLARRQAIGAQQGRIAGRLEEIAAERRQNEAQNLSSLPEANIGQTMPVRGIDNTHDVREGANSSPGGRVYIDKSIPQFSPRLKDAQGQPVNLWKYLAIHERKEGEAMASGMSYDQAHTHVATPAERAAVEADGVNWSEYTKEIDGYLDKTEHETVSNPPPETHVDSKTAIGHHRASNKAVRAAPLEAVRAHAQSATATAERLRATLGLTEKAPELPFEQTAAEGQAEIANQALTSGVQQIARRAGYNMPAEEAGQIAAKILKQSPEEAADTLRGLQMSPRQVAEAPARIEAPAEPERTAVTPVKQGPELEKAMRADLDRELAQTRVEAYHGTEATAPTAAAHIPEEAGVTFFTPNQKLAASHGTNVFKKSIDLTNSRVFNVDELVKDPQFQAEMRASLERFARRNPEAAANAETEAGRQAIENRWQALLNKIENPSERNNDLGHMRFDNAITGAIIARARKEGLDVAVIKNMAEGHGKPSDQIAVLNDKAIREPTENRIPVGVDANGNVTYQSLEDAVKEVDAYHTAADQIAACAAPEPEEKAAA